MNDPLKGRFYPQQLRTAPNASDPNFIFEIESVLKQRKVRGALQYFVKFLYYPPKFNKWIPAENITIDNSSPGKCYKTFTSPCCLKRKLIFLQDISLPNKY